MLEEFWDFIHVHNTTLTHKNLVGVSWDRCYGQRKNPWGLVVAMLTRFFFAQDVDRNARPDAGRCFGSGWVWSHGVVRRWIDCLEGIFCLFQTPAVFQNLVEFLARLHDFPKMCRWPLWLLASLLDGPCKRSLADHMTSHDIFDLDL